MLNNYNGKAVLITGGTAGIGLATALVFGAMGAQLYLTYKWGSDDEATIYRQFLNVNATKPILIQADARNDDDTHVVFNHIHEGQLPLEVFVSNVAFAPTFNDFDSMSKRALFTGLEYSAWPLINYLHESKRRLGYLPRYVVGISSGGPDHFYPRYEAVAMAKSLMEVICRYLAVELLGTDSRINMLRVAAVKTRAIEATFGPDFVPFVEKYSNGHYFVQSEEAGKAVFALCSGFLDALSGQVVTLDHGYTFADNLSYLFAHRDQHGLT